MRHGCCTLVPPAMGPLPERYTSFHLIQGTTMTRLPSLSLGEDVVTSVIPMPEPIPSSHEPFAALDVTPLSQWLDQELEKLETRFSHFITRRSFKASIR